MPGVPVPAPQPEARPDQTEPGPAGDFASLMADLARDLQTSHDNVEITLETITSTAVEIIPGVDLACVTVVSKDGRVESQAATDPAAEKINGVQQQAGQGPCLSVLWNEPMVHLADTGQDTRWPEYAAAAAELGVHSVVSVRLYVQDHVLGALSMYARTPGCFDEETVELANLYAAHAALAFAQAEETEQLQTAIDRRDVIGQAKGILMERFKITGRQAFQVLVKASQNSNISLHRVAARLADTGELLSSAPERRR